PHAQRAGATRRRDARVVALCGSRRKGAQVHGETGTRMTDEPLWRRYRDLLRRRPAADADEEVRFHLQMREQEALRAGLPPEAARAAARQRFGDVDGVVATVTAIDSARERRARRAEWLSDFRQDARFAIRSLRRAPAFAATAVATIA